MKVKVKFLALFVFIMSPLVLTQELDESFLSSLPEDVAADLIKANLNKVEQEETQYRRPSSFIKKPKPTSNRFGANIFSMMQSTLMPLNEPNFDSSYIIDFGDELQIQLVGKRSSIQKLVVKRDGSINIEDIGKIFVSGLSLDHVSSLIKDKISSSFIGVEAFVTLTNVRDIQVIMAGNIFNPGPYTLNGNSNIFHALSIAGGPSDIGSFRSINLIRNNKKIETTDLYETFIYGKSTFNTRLRSGDVIFVNPVGSIINVSGAVKRPGTYELLDDEFLSKALEFSNGLNAFADTSNIQLERIIDGKIKIIPIVNISQFDKIKNNDSDKIFIRSHPLRNISINGAVLNPGNYLMDEGTTIGDAIKKAGGLTEYAYPFGAVYESAEAKKINSSALQDLYEASIKNISEMMRESSVQVDFAPIIQILTQLKNSEASGRVVIDLNTEQDTLVKDKDIITIPEFSNQVYVYGAIASNGTALFKDDEDLDYYLEKKGGLVDNADKESIFVLQPNGESIRYSYSKNLFQSQPSNNLKIYPGSIIYVPEKTSSSFNSLLKSQAYATILGNLGIALASLSTINNNK